MKLISNLKGAGHHIRYSQEIYNYYRDDRIHRDIYNPGGKIFLPFSRNLRYSRQIGLSLVTHDAQISKSRQNFFRVLGL